jgi:hypothetical protein
LRNQRIFELVEIIEEFNPPRIECFLRRSHFDSFVKGIIGGQAFDDPYFVCFYHLILSIAANARALNWTRTNGTVGAGEPVDDADRQHGIAVFGPNDWTGAAR